jgi:hypothetical protein
VVVGTTVYPNQRTRWVGAFLIRTNEHVWSMPSPDQVCPDRGADAKSRQGRPPSGRRESTVPDQIRSGGGGWPGSVTFVRLPHCQASNAHGQGPRNEQAQHLPGECHSLESRQSVVKKDGADGAKDVVARLRLLVTQFTITKIPCHAFAIVQSRDFARAKALLKNDLSRLHARGTASAAPTSCKMHGQRCPAIVRSRRGTHRSIDS